jgi:phosphoribosylformylglycinamidine (FGAM) synthase-like enzyme
LERLFRRPEVTRLIKKSNDFGAGGVSVAIGELADGLDIYLDRVPVKYSGMNSTELAISESQERMAVVVEAKDEEEFKALCHSENIEVTHVAEVTDTARMRMFYIPLKTLLPNSGHFSVSPILTNIPAFGRETFPPTKVAKSRRRSKRSRAFLTRLRRLPTRRRRNARLTSQSKNR